MPGLHQMIQQTRPPPSTKYKLVHLQGFELVFVGCLWVDHLPGETWLPLRRGQLLALCFQ